MKAIKTDKTMNPRLRKQVQGLRNSMESAAEKQDLPKRFSIAQSKDKPAMIITDSETAKQVEVPLCDYLGARAVLNAFFGNEKKPKGQRAIKVTAQEMEEAEAEEHATTGKFIIYAECSVTTNRKLSPDEMIDVLAAMKGKAEGDGDEHIEMDISSVESAD